MLKNKFRFEFGSARFLEGYGIFVKHKGHEMLSGYSRQLVVKPHLIDEADK